MVIHSLKKRYAYKLSTSLFSFVLSLVTAGLAPRALGVSNFGAFSYLTSIFKQGLDFLDARTSACFYIGLSQKNDNQSLVVFYSIYASAILIVFLGISSLIAFSNLKTILFQGHYTGTIIFFASIFCVLTWVGDVLVNVMDAFGYTVYLEKLRFINKIVAVLLLIFLFVQKAITLNTYFYYQFFICIVLFFGIWFYLIRKRHSGRKQGTVISISDLKNQKKVFWDFSIPLLGYMAICSGVAILERSMLQRFGGNYEQGIYSFAYNLQNFVYMFITALQPLIMREMSIAIAANDQDRIRSLYRKSYSTLFYVSAYFCAFVFIEADSIVEIFGGESFKSSTNSLRIFLLNPLAYVFTSLISSVLMSSRNTGFYLKSTLITSPIGILALYFLLSPTMLNLGAVGYTVKIVGIELFSFFFIMPMLTLKSTRAWINFPKTFLHFLYVLPFILLAFCGRSLAIMLPESFGLMGHFFISGIAYTILVGAVTLFRPSIFGLNKNLVRAIYPKFS